MDPYLKIQIFKILVAQSKLHCSPHLLKIQWGIKGRVPNQRTELTRVISSHHFLESVVHAESREESGEDQSDSL